MLKSFCLVLTTTWLANCLPPPHPKVVAVRQEEEYLPQHLRSRAFHNPHLREILPLTSLLHSGEQIVYDRESDKVPRRQIYNLLIHSGLVPRQRFQQQFHQPLFHQHVHRPSHFHDPPFYPSPDHLQHFIRSPVSLGPRNGKGKSLDLTKMPPTTCKALLKDYCSNCTFAGVHFIADNTKHWFERLVWVALVVLSWYGSAILIIAAWDAFRESPISFGVETTYTQWDTELPSVAVCEEENDDKLYSVCDTIWPPGHLLDLEDTLKDIAYFRGISYSLTEVCAIANPDPMCLMSNYSYYASLVRSGCQKILTNCSYNDKPFNCCEYFQPIDTDMGTCFIINSIQTKKPKLLPMISNMRNKRSTIKFEVLLHSTMYTLAKEEIPSITSSQSLAMHLQLGHKYRRQVAVRDIDNDPLIVETTPKQRACRFHSENEGGLYPHYSYSACTVLCRRRAQLELCNCNDHFMLGTPESDRCNVTGLACIHAHASHLTTLKPPWANRPGLSCDCLPSCEETDITIIKDVDLSLRSKNAKTKAYVEMFLAFLPTERFKRIVVRSRLDLVVSVGGTTGLFVGASLLSFVELIIYFTVRFAINIWLERRERTKNVMIKEDEEDLSNDNILIMLQNRNEGLGYSYGGHRLLDQSDY